MPKLNHVVLPLVLSGLTISCNPGEGVYGQKYLFTCPNTSLNETRQYCVKEWKHCARPFADEFCSWNWYDDISHDEDFPAASWSYANCKVGAGGALEGKNFDTFPNWTCDNPGGSASTGSTTAEPTTGVPTTGSMTSSTSSSTTDDTTDGDDELVDYICAKNAHLKCADLYPDAGLGDDYPTDVLLDECWGAISPDSNVHWSPCVKAPAGPGGYDVARGKCEELCNARMDVIETSMKNACGGAFNPNCRIETEIDCVLDGPMNSWDRPFKLSESPGWECEGGTDMLPAHLGVSDFTLFEGSGTVITPDGITAGMSGVLGFVGYTLSDCNSDECTLTIDALQGLTYSVEGGFVDAAGSGGTYKFEQMGFQGRNVITGTWSKVRGIVSFPSASLDVQFWVGAVTVDGVPISSELNVHTISVDQIVGNLQSETDPLTLNFSHNTPFGTISVSLTTSS